MVSMKKAFLYYLILGIIAVCVCYLSIHHLFQMSSNQFGIKALTYNDAATSNIK
jgi:hypothetical protein